MPEFFRELLTEARRLRNYLGSRLANAIIRRAQKTPYEHLAGYMGRWWLVNPGNSKLHRGARVHHLLRSDKDRHLHNHPFWFVSIILRGGYFEITPRDQNQHPSLDGELYERRWYGPGSIRLRRASDRHKLELPAGRTAWTLFIQGKKTREWGFFTPTGFVHWRKYEQILPTTSQAPSESRRAA